MRRTRLAGAVVVGLVALAMAGPAFAGTNLVQDGKFELPKLPPGVPWQTYVAGSTFGAWSVGAGNVDLAQAWQAPSGTQSVDLEGTNADGEVHQDLATTAGGHYLIKFKLAGNPEGAPAIKTIQVTWGGVIVATFTFDTTGHTTQDMGWVTKKVKVVAQGSTTRLGFQSADEPNGHNSFGPTIDSVKVVFKGA
jgi:choice-of-anchor C domain-containing protein